MAGIKNLGGTLRESKRMMILWQPQYLTRLWCNYELSAFAYINGGAQNIDFVPLKLPLFALGLFLFHFVACLSFNCVAYLVAFSEWHTEWVVEEVSTDPAVQRSYYWAALIGLFFFGVYIIPSFFLWHFCKLHLHDRKTLLSQLRSFDMASSKCFADSDRKFVQELVVDWFGSIDALNEYMRTDMYQLMASIIGGSVPVRYGIILVGSFSHLFITTSWSAQLFIQGEHTIAAHFLLCTVCLYFCSDAIAMNLTLRLAALDFGENVKGRSFFSRRLAGPFSTAVIWSMAVAPAVSIFYPCVPLWVDIVLTVIFCAATIVLWQVPLSSAFE